MGSAVGEAAAASIARAIGMLSSTPPSITRNVWGAPRSEKMVFRLGVSFAVGTVAGSNANGNDDAARPARANFHTV